LIPEVAVRRNNHYKASWGTGVLGDAGFVELLLPHIFADPVPVPLPLFQDQTFTEPELVVTLAVHVSVPAEFVTVIVYNV
jgi:hypothetical protein